MGGTDNPLHCVVVQEVFPDGIIAGDGRLQPGNQIIRINVIDMTCAMHIVHLMHRLCIIYLFGMA